jgi:nucleotide sugar dehydrogenase
MKIGIIGKGFVGGAVMFGFSANTGCDAEVKVYDKNPNRSLNTLDEVVNESDFIFLSVPTPANLDGSVNLDMVYEALSSINDITKKDNIILLRSTMTPGSTAKFQKKYPDLKLVFNPEFLTERNAKFDFINQSRYIIGGEPDNTAKVAEMYRWRFGKSISVIETDTATAELIKYMNNCFFATKVSFMNEMRLVSDASGADWETAVDGFIRDGRIGHSHLNVPGHDGKFGFGGVCFPIDILAMIDLGKKLGVEMHTLKGAWETNLKVRPEKDWEKLEGQAVVKKTK